MGGYICDNCRKVIIPPTDVLFGAVAELIQKDFTVAILCTDCNLLPIEHLLKVHNKSSKKSPRKFWVEIQNIPAETEPPEFTEAIYIQRNREDLDNLGEVFQVTEDI